jgi:allantoin racemase
LGTDVFDDPIRVELERVKRADTEVEVRSLGRGPHHLEYSCYEAAAVPEILTLLVQAEAEGFDAAVIGCFYDTGLRPARELTSRMAVAAPCESAVHIASTLGDSFSVVVGRRKWVPEMRDNVIRYGFGERLASFKVLELGVHDFQADPAETHRRIASAGRDAVEHDGAEVLVLGCTAEFGFFEHLQDELGVPVIDATVAPFKYAELLGEVARLGWRPSEVGGYARPPEAELDAFGLGERLAPRTGVTS